MTSRRDTVRPGPEHARAMRAAIALAVTGMTRGDGGPFGAVVVKDGRIVGRGWNRVLATHDPTAHAEIVAVRAACRRLRTHVLAGCEIFASCDPCPMCLAAIHWARIDRIWYAANVALELSKPAPPPGR